MRIDYNTKPTLNPAFNGIYKMPLTKNNFHEFKEYVIPACLLIKKQPIQAFPGRNPVESCIDKMLDDLAAENKGSLEWLKQNALNHGVNFPLPDNDTLYIITAKDVPEYEKFIDARLKSISKVTKNFNNIFTKFFAVKKLKKEMNLNLDNLPPHLQQLTIIDSFNKRETRLFEQFIAGKVTEVKDSKSLLERIMTE